MSPTPRRPRLALEPLDRRDVPAAVRSLDGSGNNLLHPAWGQAGTDFLRLAPVSYADGVSAPTAGLPGARAVSNAVADQQGGEVLNDRQLSALVYAWGQFVDHDLDLTQAGTAEAFPIPVPAGDPSFDPAGTGTQTIDLTRSAGDPLTGTGAANPRQQVNRITAFLDGSMVYGSDAATATSLRTLSGGRMKTSAGDLLPVGPGGFFQAGDARANENPELTSLQTLFVREHNRLAARFAAADPALTDEQLYQKARAWVIGELQAVTFNEWLPALTGSALPAYRGYDPGVNPGISNEFATAAFRFGHSVVGADIEFLGNDGTPVAPGLSFADAFFNPQAVQANGIDPLLKYLASDPAQELDTKVVDELRNLLLATPGAAVRLDLAALNVQRGRDHGLADYNSTRAAVGLPRVTTFAQITADVTLQAKLRALYGSVDKIDLWVGVLAEDHLKGSSVGATLKAILADQFGRLRAGDRFWYENTFTGRDLQQLRGTRLADIIARNTGLTTVQADPFVFRPTVSGTVTSGRLPAAGLAVRLVAADGSVAATSTTDARGRYRFDVAGGLRTGRYTLEVVRADGTVTAGPAVAVRTGDAEVTADISLTGAGQPAPPHRPRPHRPGRFVHVAAPPLDGFTLGAAGTDLVPRPRGR